MFKKNELLGLLTGISSILLGLNILNTGTVWGYPIGEGRIVVSLAAFMFALYCFYIVFKYRSQR
jgi:hypothetical protein|tara:strand:+ start:223 stop:414 length:192 start_codon:yes stop_codon:yes gene_type:complete